MNEIGEEPLQSEEPWELLYVNNGQQGGTILPVCVGLPSQVGGVVL